MLILFNKLEPIVALEYVPLTFTSREVVSSTLAYWEGPMGWSQDQLTPVYGATIKALLPDGTTQTYQAFIPANSTYMSPYAKIVAPEAAILMPGAQIVLEAADAAKTLAELGVDPALTFALGTGDPDSYKYYWYVNEAADAAQIGTGRTLTYTLKESDLSEKANGELTVNFVLRVEDSNQTHQPGVSTDSLVLSNSRVFLPLIAR